MKHYFLKIASWVYSEWEGNQTGSGRKQGMGSYILSSKTFCCLLKNSSSQAVVADMHNRVLLVNMSGRRALSRHIASSLLVRDRIVWEAKENINVLLTAFVSHFWYSGGQIY